MGIITMTSPTARAFQSGMLSARDTAKFLGMSMSQLNVLISDEDAGLPVSYLFSPSRRGWRLFRHVEVLAWLESKRAHHN